MLGRWSVHFDVGGVSKPAMDTGSRPLGSAAGECLVPLSENTCIVQR
jgi:hypothetical protein